MERMNDDAKCQKMSNNNNKITTKTLNNSYKKKMIKMSSMLAKP